MKNTLFRVINIGIVAASALTLVGCVSSTPATVQSIPAVTSTPSSIAGAAPALTTNYITVTNPPVFVASPQLAVVESNVQATVAAYAPVVTTLYPAAAPVVPLAQDALAGIFGVLTAVSTAVAYFRNKSANTQTAVAATLASHIVSTSPATVPALLQNTTDATGAITPLTAAVQAHLTQQTI